MDTTKEKTYFYSLPIAVQRILLSLESYEVANAQSYHANFIAPTQIFSFFGPSVFVVVDHKLIGTQITNNVRLKVEVVDALNNLKTEYAKNSPAHLDALNALILDIQNKQDFSMHTKIFSKQLVDRINQCSCGSGFNGRLYSALSLLKKSIKHDTVKDNIHNISEKVKAGNRPTMRL